MLLFYTLWSGKASLTGTFEQKQRKDAMRILGPEGTEQCKGPVVRTCLISLSTSKRAAVERRRTW